MSSIQWILLILCIAAIMLYFKALKAPVCEGYAGPIQPIYGRLPMAAQTSFIPRDTAAATTVNPQLAKPDYRDFANARQSFRFFLEAYSPEAALGTGKQGTQGEIAAMLLDAPRFLQKIETYILKPEEVPSRDILERAIEAEALANAMRRVGPADPWSVGWERPGCSNF